MNHIPRKLWWRIGARILAGILVAFASIPGALPAPGSGHLLATDPATGSLYEIDPQTGAVSLLSVFGFPATALASDPTTGILYFAGEGISPTLYRIDANSSGASFIGSMGSDIDLVSGFDFDSSGTLYGAVRTGPNGGTGGIVPPVPGPSVFLFTARRRDPWSGSSCLR